MRALIIVDKTGKILATAPHQNRDRLAPQVGLAAHLQYTAHVVDLPVELEGKSLIELHHSWELSRVDKKMVLSQRSNEIEYGKESV